ncbi:LolA-related protein [Xanthomonas euvesicatoria]|nr:LolA-related protein [Xanthomonas euvesicatoria]AOY67476.1 fatty acyl CoA synthetase [Xanthomonas euvesicatoria pv. vesicatoria str. 85-10]APO93182.1 fatty acyl CoA synthetase [Xanthomonas euvesicatoria]KHL60837.1 fatty acyl CoA synthetase [Xanthomonas euvesicatoria]KLA91075.1 fatty acyl CoA synthetase [Xanthomonas euvesicatoria]KLB33474.1 fatty acyl CoA synthetase [Xanthomonas euvesicatoria]
MPMCRTLPWMLILLFSAAPLCAAPPETLDVGQVLQRLAHPAPVSTEFVELRGSALLKTPLRVEGHYRRPDAQTLVREVSAPYHETTTLTGDEGVLEREGKSPRRFSLSRVPELAGLKSGFGALLSGDRALLEQHYRVSGQGQPQAWQLTLQPKDAAVAKQVHELRLYGGNDELRCIESVPAKGDMQRTLLAGAARAAAGVTDAAALTALCHGSGA